MGSCSPHTLRQGGIPHFVRDSPLPTALRVNRSKDPILREDLRDRFILRLVEFFTPQNKASRRLMDNLMLVCLIHGIQLNPQCQPPSIYKACIVNHNPGAENHCDNTC